MTGVGDGFRFRSKNICCVSETWVYVKLNNTSVFRQNEQPKGGNWSEKNGAYGCVCFVAYITRLLGDMVV